MKRASAPEISPRSQTPTTSEEFNVAKLPRASLARQLFEEPYQFDFFQAVRLLEKLIPRRVMLGGAGPIQREVVRLRARQSLDFPPSSVHELLPPGAASPLPLMTISFFGMTGPMGVLPRHYTELLMRQEREYRGPERYVFRDWLDQFNHRMASFFYRAWVKYRLFVPFERGEYARQDPDDFTRALLSIVGLGTPRLRDRLRITQRPAVTSDVAEPAGADLGEADDPEKVLAQVNDLALFRFGGLLCRQPRNAVSLEAILHGFFRLPVEIRQHQGQWLRLEPGSQSMLGKQRLNNAMGRNVVVGDRVWDVQSKIRVRLGPLDYDQFLEFLPDRTPVARRKRIYLLAHVVRLYVGMEVDAEVQLVLKSSEVPSCQLGAKKGFGSRLGWNTWARRKRMRRDGDEPVFPAEDRRHV